MSEGVRYRSTRGDAPELGFGDVLLTGLATDGGLYCPDEIPSLPDDLHPGLGYTEIAERVIRPFVASSIDDDELRAMVEAAYASFRHPDVTPLVDLGDGQHLLDLTRGPTLAFKDVALQLVGRLFEHELGRRDSRTLVLAATSGDTGSAAIEALAGRSGVAVTVLHPKGRVSDVQRRQMTTVVADNVMNVAVDGTFDDCQDLVKAGFNDAAIRAELSLGAVNSINWARVMAQIVYYVVAWLRLGGERSISFCVPTGNFGNVLSGWYAKRMGVPIDRLVVASNRNDVLTRWAETGGLRADEVIPSLSPSMDIQVSSNFERLLWEASGRNSTELVDVLTRFRREGTAAVPTEWHRAILDEFDFGRVDDDGTVAEIRRMADDLDVAIDPHTAVATAVARDHATPGVPMVSLATADPAKFPDAVESATGVRPELPPFLSELFDRPERFEEAPADLGAVVDLVRRRWGGTAPTSR